MGSVKGYMGIIYAGLIVTAAYNSLAAFLRALGDSKSPLYFLIISAVINVFLDILFIVKIGMGVEGCAYATVIAQAISAVCCLIYIIKKFPILHLKKENFEVSFTSFRYLLALGIPMGLQFSITAIGTIIVQGAVNIYGSVYMAGFSAAGKIQNIIATVFVAFGATMATYVGQNRGAGKMDRVKAGMKYTQIMILIWSVITMIIMFFFGKYMTWLFIDKSQTDVINVSVTYFHTVFWHIRSLEVSSSTETDFRDWDMAWFPCWAVCLNWRQEVQSLCLLQEKQVLQVYVWRILPHGSQR